jgi:MFS superfamily sulfate permease-like transporter
MYPVAVCYQVSLFKRNKAKDVKKSACITTAFLAIDLVVSAALILIGILSLYSSSLISLNPYVKLLIPLTGMSIIVLDVSTLFTFCKFYRAKKRIAERDKKLLVTAHQSLLSLKNFAMYWENSIRELTLELEVNYRKEEEYKKFQKEQATEIALKTQSGADVKIENGQEDKKFLKLLLDQRKEISENLQYAEDRLLEIQGFRKDLIGVEKELKRAIGRQV